MIIPLLSRTVLLLALLAPRAVAGQAPDAFALLESAGKAYRAANGLCADFRQTLSVPLLGEDRVGSGRLCTRQPGLFSMRYTDPAGDLLLADGTWMWMYTPSSDAKQVLRWRMTQGPRGVDFYKEFLESPRQKYRAAYKGRETVVGESVHHIVLTPVQPAPYRTAEVWIDGDGVQLRQVQIREANGSVRTVTLTAVDARSVPGADAFTFTPPAGAQVITR